MPQRMKKSYKGMLITKASSSEALLQIAETIKDQYTNKKSMKLHFLSTMKIAVITKKNYLTNLLVRPNNRHIRFRILGSTNIILNE